MKKRLWFALVILSCFGCVGAPTEALSTGRARSALSTCTTIQRGIAGTVNDAEVWGNAPTAALGAQPWLIFGPIGAYARHALIKYDLSTIHAGQHIDSATAYFTDQSASAAGTVSAYLITGAWGESTVTWNGAPPSATSATSFTSVPAGVAGTSWSMDLTTAAMGWYSGAVPNYGFMLNGVATSLYASESPIGPARPKLIVCTSPLPTCSDAVQNGAETAIDCGGGTCPTCANGLACLVNTDCASGNCSAGICAAGPCSNGVKDGAETDVDCGGGTCAPCASGKRCAVNGDCIAGDYCEAGNASWTPAGGPTCYALGASLPAITSGALPAPIAGCWSVSTSSYTTDGLLADVYAPTGVSGCAAQTGRVVGVNHPGADLVFDRTWYAPSVPVLPHYCEALASRGDVCVSFDYTLAGPSPLGSGTPYGIYPASISDARCQARWMRANAAGWGASPSRLSMVGLSYGGTMALYEQLTADLPSVYDTGIAATVPLDDGRCPIAFSATADAHPYQVIAAWYAPTDLLALMAVSGTTWPPIVFGEATTDPGFNGRATAASPLTWVRPGMGDVFVECGTYDGQVPCSQMTAMDAALRAHGSNVVAVTVAGGNHFADPLAGGIYGPASLAADGLILSH